MKLGTFCRLKCSEWNYKGAPAALHLLRPNELYHFKGRLNGNYGFLLTTVYGFLNAFPDFSLCFHFFTLPLSE